MCSSRHSLFCILPPHILRTIAERGTLEERTAATRTLATLDSTFRALRATPLALSSADGHDRRRPNRQAADDLHGEPSSSSFQDRGRERSDAPEADADVAIVEAFNGLSPVRFLLRRLRSAIDRR